MASLDSAQPRGQRILDSSIQDVPAVATPLSAVDTWIYQLSFTNAGAAGVFTVVDGNGRPVISAASYATNSGGIAVWPEGLKCAGGVTWDGGAGTFTASVVAFTVG